MRKRNVEVKFRLSEAEYAELVQKVKDSGLNRNAFLVRMVRQQTIYPVDYLRELNKQMDVEKYIGSMMMEAEEGETGEGQ